jgi:NADH-quinone oxidoreductase subunit I
MNSAARYFSNIGKGFWTVLVGMKVTMRHLFTPAVTIQYPDARMTIPERGRNRLYVNMDDCIGCNQCAMACPVDCIIIETAKSLPTEDLGVTSTGQKKRLWVTQFDIDFGKCCYCGLCVPPCPTECIYMTNVFEFSDYDRKNLIYSFITLTPDEVAQKINQAQEAEREAAAKKAAAAAAQKAAQAAQKPAAPPVDAVQKPALSSQAASVQQNPQTSPKEVEKMGSPEDKARPAPVTGTSNSENQDPSKKEKPE